MANIVSNRMLTDIAEGSIDLENDVIRVALMTDSYSPNKDTNTFVNTNEISGTGYTAGGALLVSSTITQDDTNNRSVWDAGDVEWTASTFVARYAIVYDTTVSDTILLVIDFDEDKSCSEGVFAIKWDDDGIMTLSQS